MITNAGQQLIANAIAGSGEIAITAVKTSSHTYSASNIPNLTDLEDIEQTVQNPSAGVFNNTMVQVSARLDNQDVSSPYLIQTLGIYAQIGSGSETLLAVSLATSPDQMPAESDASLSAFIYNIQMTIQQASQLTFTVNPAGTATLQDLQDMLALIRRVILVPFPASGWSSSPPYTQTAQASGIESIDTPTVGLYVPVGTGQDEEAAIIAAYGGVTYVDTGKGTITATCVGKKPEDEFTMAVKGV